MRSARSRPSRSTRLSIATSRRSSSPATPRRPSRSATSGGATTCRSWASSGRVRSAAALATRNRRVGVIATPATVRSHAYFTRSRRRTRRSRSTSTPRRRSSRSSRRAAERAGRRGDGGRRAGAAPGRARRGRRVRLPAAGVRPDRHAAPGLHPLPAAPAGDRRPSPATAWRSSTRRRRRRRPWQSCSRSTGSRRRRGDGASPIRRPTSS